MWAIWLIGFLIFSHRVAVDMNVIAVRKMTVLCKQFKHLEVITIPFFIYHSECSIFLDLHIETEVLIVLLLDFVKVTCRCNELFLFTLSFSLSCLKKCYIVLIQLLILTMLTILVEFLYQFFLFVFVGIYTHIYSLCQLWSSIYWGNGI